MQCNRGELIKAGVREGFRNGASKHANRRCYGYDVTVDGTLVINPDEAKVVRWMFQRYLYGDSLGKIASGLQNQGILSPTGKSTWNREAIDKLLSNEKYIGFVLFRRQSVLVAVKFRITDFRISSCILKIMTRLYPAKFFRQYRMRRYVEVVNYFAQLENVFYNILRFCLQC